MVKNILLVGVGGQGTILASKILTLGLIEAGYDVKMSEIHGMSQRGGAVSSQVRYGDKVFSPVIERGSADIIVAFEKMEALRWLNYLGSEGNIIVNNYEINPMPVVSGAMTYSPDILETLQSNVKVIPIDAYNEAEKIGNTRVLNIIMLGAIVEKMGLSEIDWNSIIANEVKKNFVETNQKAFMVGQQLVRGY